MRRIAIVASHPVQYQAPWFRALARAVDLTVFFCHQQSADDQSRAGFSTPFEWDVPLLDGYRHVWLRNVAADPGVGRWSGCDTPDIGRLLEEGRFDACIVNGWYLKSYIQTIRAARRLRLPILVRGDSQLVTPRPLLKRMAKALPYRWLLQSVDGHLFVGQRNRAYLRHYGVELERLFFVPHFVDNEWFRAEALLAMKDRRVATIRKACAPTDATTVFLYAGKLIPRKRVRDFIDALAQLQADDLDVSGLVVGSGPEENALRTHAAEAGCRIDFAGFRNQSQMAARYAAADCLVLPSDGHETWGLVVNEAMATGMPAITSDAVGCGPDLIDPGRTGFVYPVGDVNALANRMRDVLKLRATNWDAVRQYVHDRVDRYSEAVAVRGTLQAIETACGASASRNGLRDPQHA